MTIEAVIFDFGGVLVRLVDPRGQRRWEQRLGLAEGALLQTVLDTDASTRAMVGQLSEDEMWRELGAFFGLDEAQAQQLRRDFWSGEQYNAELVEFIRTLRPRFKTAILSNAWSGARAALTHTFRLDREMDVIIISAEEGVAKPDRRIYELAAERLGVPIEAAVFVDDMLENVHGAQAAGMRVVHFQDTAQAIAEIHNHLDGA